MGLLSVGHPLTWDETQKQAEYVRQHGIIQFVNTYHKLKERQVFLFEQILIFSEVTGHKTQFSIPSYTYKNHLQVNKMSLHESPDDDECKFVLKSKDPRQDDLSFIIQANCVEEKYEWVRNIEALLKTQLDFLRALQSPISYQKEV